MKFPWNPNGPLKGRYVFLSASVPNLERDERFLRGPDGEENMKMDMLRVIDQRVDEAVKSFVAQVFMAGGRIVHGGHPLLTPILADQAGHWVNTTEGGDPPVATYQSRHFETFPAIRGRVEMERAGVAQTHWVARTLTSAGKAPRRMEVKQHKADSPSGEELQPPWFPQDLLEKWLPMQAPEERAALCEPLLAMRLCMLLESAPIATVCMGGMEGVEAEASLYLDLVGQHRLKSAETVHVIGSTFGAAAQLNDQRHEMIDRPGKLEDEPDYDEVMAKLMKKLIRAASQE